MSDTVLGAARITQSTSVCNLAIWPSMENEYRRSEGKLRVEWRYRYKIYYKLQPFLFIVV